MSNSKHKPAAFTIKSTVGITNQLITTVKISTPNSNVGINVNAIWDTGASASVITTQVVKNLSIAPSGVSLVHTANGQALQNTYIVDIVLPNNVMVKDVTVTEAPGLSSNCEVLIGMDIISLGDFAVSNYNGNTVMSFRTPSMHEVDYVKNIAGKFIKNIPAGYNGSNRTPPKKKRQK